MIVTSSRGSTLMPLKRAHFSATAWRNSGEPQVKEYWCDSVRERIAGKASQKFPRRIEVRKPLREVDAADLGAEPRHLADHRLLEGARAPRQGQAASRRSFALPG